MSVPMHACPEEAAFQLMSSCGENSGLTGGEIAATVGVLLVLVGAGVGLWWWLKNKY